MHTGDEDAGGRPAGSERESGRRDFLRPRLGGRRGRSWGPGRYPVPLTRRRSIQATETIKIVTALPMTGSSYGQTITIVNAVRLAIEEVSRRSAASSSSSSPGTTPPPPPASGTRPRRPSWPTGRPRDPNIMVYIGHFNSGAAKITIPVLNQVGLVMISPANTYPGLTKPGKGEPGEPGVYYPTGVRNYTRVVPADDLQGAVGAGLRRRRPSTPARPTWWTTPSSTARASRTSSPPPPSASGCASRGGTGSTARPRTTAPWRPRSGPPGRRRSTTAGSPRTTPASC